MNEVIINVPVPKLNVDVIGETDEYQVELKQTGSLCELVIYSGQNISGGSSGSFNPALDYAITGNWTYSQTIDTVSDGDSSQWKLGYDHSLLVTGQVHGMWTKNGTDVYYNDGNVGIGDNNPQYGRLQITQSSDGFDKGIAIFNSIGSRTLRLWVDGANNARIYSGDGTGNLILNSGGNVGIGPTAPLAKLTVNTSTGNNFEIRDAADWGAGYTGVAIDSRDETRSSRNNLMLVGDDIIFNPSGNVGIGTNTPSTPLTIGYNSGSNQIALKRSDGAEAGFIYIDSVNAINIQPTSGSSDINFKQNVPGDGHIITFNIDGNTGNAGIGISNSSYKLHIKKDQAADTICKVENLTNTGRASLQADSRLGTAYLHSIGDAYTAVSDWANSALLGADGTLTGGLVIYNASTPGVRFQNVAGTNLFSIYNSVPRFHAPTIFEERIGTDVFASGFAGNGWEVKDYTTSGPARYTATFDNLVVRRTMKVYELEINKIRASNGSLWVSDAMEAEFTEALTSSYKLKVLDELDMPFLVDDIVRTQSWTGDGIKFWEGKVLSTGSESISGETYGWAEVEEFPSGAAYTDEPENGDVFVRVDHVGIIYPERKGAVYLTSSDTGGPFMDVVYGMETEATGVRVRVGRLAGITDTDAGLNGGEWQNDLFGLYGQNVHLKGHIFAQTGEIGGWELASNKLWSGTDWNNGAAIDYGMELDSTALRMVNFRDSANYVRIWNTNDTDWGIEGEVAGNKIFELGSNNQIAGWSFNNEAIYNNIDSTHIALGYPQDWSSNWYGLHIGSDSNNRIFIGSIGTSYTISHILGGAYIFQLGSAINQIAGWAFNSNSIFNGTDVVLSSSNKSVSVANSAVQMYYTSASDYGIKDSTNKFQLGYTNQIAGWNFDTHAIYKEDIPHRIYINNSETIIGSGVAGRGYTLYTNNDASDGGSIVDGFKIIRIGMLANANSINSFPSTPNYGIQILGRETSTTYKDWFRVDKDGAKIAGWSFDNSKIYNSNIILDNANSSIKVFKASTTDYVEMNYTDEDDWGFKGVVGGAIIFQLNDVNNQISSFDFDEYRMVKYTGTTAFASGNGVLMQGDSEDGTASSFTPSFQAYKHNGTNFTTQAWLGMQYAVNDNVFTGDTSTQDLSIGVVTKSSVGAEYNKFIVKAEAGATDDLEMTLKSSGGDVIAVMNQLPTSATITGQLYRTWDMNLGVWLVSIKV